MKRPLAARHTVCPLLFAAFCLWASCTPAHAVIWEILPFPDNNWPGSHGQPATTNGGVVTLKGQPVRTLQSFSGPLRISYDVFLPERLTDDGLLSLMFLPTGVPTNQTIPNVKFSMEYRNGGSDDLLVNQDDQGILWTVPFNVITQSVYHCAINLSAAGQLTWAINNVTNSIPDTITVPYSSYKLEFQGWQPDTIWQVSNFAVVPEPSTAILVVIGVGLLGIIRSRKSS